MAESSVRNTSTDLTKLLSKLEELQRECQKSLTENPADEILKNCNENCENAKQMAESSSMDAFRLYTKALLDYTYFEENKLVDEEFPESSSKERLNAILGRLSSVEIIVDDIYGSNADIIEVLGIEIMECLHWRRGALLYMYCHTVQEDQDRVKRNLQDFTQSLIDGVDYLNKMVNLRITDQQVDYHDDSTLKLIQQGIFSDTHLLALMYSGEMCYWYATVTVTVLEHDIGQLNKLITTGKRVLEKFIRIVNGPLKGAGWDCSRAKHLLEQLNTYKSASS